MTMSRKKYTLSAEACDAVAGDIMDFCRRAGVSRKDALRCRLSAEDCLTHWQKRLGEDAEVTLQMGRRFGSPLVILRAEGPKADPGDSATRPSSSSRRAKSSEDRPVLWMLTNR